MITELPSSVRKVGIVMTQRVCSSAYLKGITNFKDKLSDLLSITMHRPYLTVLCVAAAAVNKHGVQVDKAAVQ